MFKFWVTSLILALAGASLTRMDQKPVNATLCASKTTCTVGGLEGTCVSKSAGCCYGKVDEGVCPGVDSVCCTNPKPLGISRNDIIARAQDWVDRQIPYSWYDYTDGYRQDCSGMVSMAWASSTAGGGHTTYNMQEICYAIDRSQLQRGDAILNPNQHVLLFDYWIDGDAFMQYAEIDWGRVASHNQVSYSYFANNGYFPCRFVGVN